MLHYLHRSMCVIADCSVAGCQEADPRSAYTYERAGGLRRPRVSLFSRIAKLQIVLTHVLKRLVRMQCRRRRFTSNPAHHPFRCHKHLDQWVDLMQAFHHQRFAPSDFKTNTPCFFMSLFSPGSAVYFSTPYTRTVCRAELVDILTLTRIGKHRCIACQNVQNVYY